MTLADKRGRFAQRFRDGRARSAPPSRRPADAPSADARRWPSLARADPAVVARLAAGRLAATPARRRRRSTCARPTPCRSSDPVPVLLDDA